MGVGKMDIERLRKEYLPMSETAYYTLLSLREVRHGYGIMQDVEAMTDGRIRLGAGTLYGSLSRMEKDQLIESAGEVDRRKLYRLTASGRALLKLEVERLKELYENGCKFGGELL
jgi:DNA-binding PadR family transcriptional regulator